MTLFPVSSGNESSSGINHYILSVFNLTVRGKVLMLQSVSWPGFRNWVPIIGRFLRGITIYSHISTISMNKFIKIRHDFIKQCHGNYKMKKFNHKLEIEIFRNSTKK